MHLTNSVTKCKTFYRISSKINSLCALSKHYAICSASLVLTKCQQSATSVLTSYVWWSFKIKTDESNNFLKYCRSFQWLLVNSSPNKKLSIHRHVFIVAAYEQHICMFLWTSVVFFFSSWRLWTCGVGLINVNVCAREWVRSEVIGLVCRITSGTAEDRRRGERGEKEPALCFSSLTNAC